MYSLWTRISPPTLISTSSLAVFPSESSMFDVVPQAHARKINASAAKAILGILSLHPFVV